MYTKEEYGNLLREIAESGGDTPKMLELMQKLRDDYDDREGMLRRYQEERDSDPIEGETEEEEKIRKESERDDEEDKGLRRDTIDWESKYRDLEKKYIDRFFSGDKDSIEELEPEKKNEKDVTLKDLYEED